MATEEIEYLSDEDIRTDDIPELDEAFWQKAKVRLPKVKSVVSLRLPDDVVQYFKAHNPRGHTSHMAAVLTAYVKAQRKNES